MKTIKSIITALLALSFYACNENLPLEEAVEKTEVEMKSDPLSTETQPQQTESEMVISETHKIEALEVLQSANYVYVKAKEGPREYWLAAMKMPIEVGGIYTYSSGMISTNFKSKEHNRVFDELVLVNALTPENGEMVKSNPNRSPKKTKGDGTIEFRENGSIPIGDIVENASLFEGKKVKVQGKCTKVNVAILNKNWVHLDDGSNNGYDFIATTQTDVSVGDELILEGILVLNKDFGAGYVYEVLLEDCVIIP